MSEAAATAASEGAAPPPGGVMPPEADVPRTTIFISYAREDRRHVDRLKKHLKPLMRMGRIRSWDDHNIRPGEHWKKEIDAAIRRSKIAITIVSADFYDSDFITNFEIPRIKEEHEKGQLQIIPVVAGPSYFDRDPFLSQFNSINRPERPLSKIGTGERDKHWNYLAAMIEREFPSGGADLYTATEASSRGWMAAAAVSALFFIIAVFAAMPFALPRILAKLRSKDEFAMYKPHPGFSLSPRSSWTPNTRRHASHVRFYIRDDSTRIHVTSFWGTRLCAFDGSTITEDDPSLETPTVIIVPPEEGQISIQRGNKILLGGTACAEARENAQLRRQIASYLQKWTIVPSAGEILPILEFKDIMDDEIVAFERSGDVLRVRRIRLYSIQPPPIRP